MRNGRGRVACCQRVPEKREDNDVDMHATLARCEPFPVKERQVAALVSEVITIPVVEKLDCAWTRRNDHKVRMELVSYKRTGKQKLWLHRQKRWLQIHLAT